MPHAIAICPAEDVLEGEIRGASLPDGRRIALYRETMFMEPIIAACLEDAEERRVMQRESRLGRGVARGPNRDGVVVGVQEA